MKLSLSSLFFIAVFLVDFPLIKLEENTFKRNIETSVNPNCEKYDCESRGVNIVYVKASSKDDVLHYIFGGGNFTETLSVIIIRSINTRSTLSIDYPKLFNGSKSGVLNITGGFDGAFGLIFTKLYEYNDKDDTVAMKSDNWLIKSFNQFIWQAHKLNPNSFSFKSNSSKDLDNNLFIKSNSNIEIKLNQSDEARYSDGMPHLFFTGNNTQIDFILKNLTTNFTNSRFAVQVALINNINVGEMNIESLRSLDDERSPGVFKINNFNGQSVSVNWQNSTYLQWKPVCYISEFDRSLNSISVAQNFLLQPFDTDNITAEAIKSSVAYLFFGDKILEKSSSMRLMNITFGLSGDKGYSKYLIWTSSFGQGEAHSDKISIAVILVIALGLGLPFVLVVVGSIYLVVKKRMRMSISYNSIEDPIN